jgi:uncharacterized protein (TIGR02117 family)
MKIVRKIFKWFLYVLAVPVLFMVISLILSAITINKKDKMVDSNSSIFLHTSGIHLDVIIPAKDVNSFLMNGLEKVESNDYVSFGWGDENFYINTPTWADLTVSNACTALFLKSSSLMHITRHSNIRSDWIEIKVNDEELKSLNNYISKAFAKDESGEVVILENMGYSSIDDFYKANGSYSCFNTCNTWINKGFKDTGLKACYWTPFDFGLMNKYKN